ncbi:hypothetical protein G9274_000995 [Stenotrophomonas rhizophila]|nr:hypothetical protein G9274_000995 [Stenotrophomonas rhizophila]
MTDSDAASLQLLATKSTDLSITFLQRTRRLL